MNTEDNENKPINLDELLGAVKPKKESRLEKHFFSKMTPEEIKAWRVQAGKKRAATKQRIREERESIVQKARDLIPEVMAYDLAQEETGKLNWVPKQETIDKIKMLLEKDVPLEKLRSKYFATISDDTWHKLMKYVFKSHVSDSTDLGVSLQRSKDSQALRLKKSIREVRKQIKVYLEEKKTKIIPAYLLHLKSDLEKRLSDLEMEFSKTIFTVGAVGEKSKSPSLHIHTSIPRPKKEEKIVEEV